MATLTVWKFPDAAGAERAVETLQSLQKQQLITLIDGATVSWAPDAKKPKTRQLHNLAGAGAMSGMFWGMLFGLLFFVPLFGMAIGAAAGAAGGAAADVGIDDDFIKRVRDEITPGTSALFAMTENAVLDKVHDAFAGSQAELIQTNLPSEKEQELREVFA